MTIDYIGYYLFPSVIWLDVIGRISFPCFLYGRIEGTKRTSNYPFYIFHLFLLALFLLALKYPKYFIVFLTLSVFVEYSIYGTLFGWTL